MNAFTTADAMPADAMPAGASVPALANSARTFTCSIGAALQRAALALRPYSESPRLDAILLLGNVLGLSRAALAARHDEPLCVADQLKLDELIAVRAREVPIAYLTGSREFWSLSLIVTPAVLVPRPETEMLVQQALDSLPQAGVCSVLDLGTGSGAVALSLAHERPRWRITGTDVSPDALAVAAKNSQALGLPGITWRLGRWFDAVPDERFDMIVSNPPYISASDPALMNLSAEPALALIAGPSGLESFEHIVANAPRHLLAGGWLLLEHGGTQAPEVARLLAQHGFASIRSIPDFSGTPRITLGLHTPHQEHS